MRNIKIASIIALLCGLSNSEILNGIYRWVDPNCLPKNHHRLDSTLMCHDESIIIHNDSFFMNTSPVMLEGGKKYYSSSDGGFHYYAGVIERSINHDSVRFSIQRCDYCIPALSTYDSATGYNHPRPYNAKIMIKGHKNRIIIGNQTYHRISKIINQDRSEFALDSSLLSKPIRNISIDFIRQSILELLQELNFPENSSLLVLASPLLWRDDENLAGLRLPKSLFLEQKTNLKISIIDSIPNRAESKILRIARIYEHPHRASISICISPADSICTMSDICYELIYIKSSNGYKKISTRDSNHDSKLIDSILGIRSPTPVSSDCTNNMNYADAHERQIEIFNTMVDSANAARSGSNRNKQQ